MQEEWQKNAEMFERDVAAEASWDASRAGEMVDEFISEHWMPRKKSRGARYSTREETLAYYKRVRAIADRYIAKEEGGKPEYPKTVWPSSTPLTPFSPFSPPDSPKNEAES